MKRAMLLAAVAAAALATPAASDVKAGIEAWQRGDYADAIKEWQPTAAAGDPDAEFNLGQAYKLGKGVPLDLDKAQFYYRKAADQGHVQAEANYGLVMFQNGDRAAAIPWLQKAADKGEPRAQYVVGTALFNGDFGNKDWPRAYAYMTRASAAGLPQAGASLRQMDQFLTAPDRQKGLDLAQKMAQPTPVVSSLAEAQALQTAGPPRPAGIAPTALPPSQPALASEAPPSSLTKHGKGAKQPKLLPGGTPAPVPAPTPIQTASAASAPVAPPPRPPRAPKPEPRPAAKAPEPKPIAPKPVETASAPKAHKAEVHALAPASGGKWRIQLGAYSTAVAADAAWHKASGTLSGFQRYTSAAGSMTRLQAGPFGSRAAPAKGCAAASKARLACFPVATP